MSVDLSAPAISSTRQQILDKSSPTTWFMLSYGSPPSALQLVASGNDPSLPHIRDIIDSTTEDVLFGYAEISGKGLIVAFLRDNVGGVRRARAVVHSRAVASLFPDYAALITVAHHSQLSDEEVADKLGLSSLQTTQPRAHEPPHHPSSSSTPTRDQLYPAHLGKHTPTRLAIGRATSPSPSSSPVEPSPPVPEKDYPVSASRSFSAGPARASGSTSSLASQGSERSRTSSRRGPSTPKLQRELHLAGDGQAGTTGSAGDSTPPRRTAHPGADEHLDTMSTPSGKPSPLPRAPPVDTTPQSNRIVSAPMHTHSPMESKGISSADVFPDNQRQRKTSLTSRLGQLGHAFGRNSPRSPKMTSSPTASTPGAMASSNAMPSPSSPKELKSPGSPTIARSMNSNLARNFGRRASGGPTPPASPGAGLSNRQSVPPPPPPKDEEDGSFGETRPFRQETSPPSRRTDSDEQSPREGETNANTNGLLGAHVNGDLTRSTSGQRALSEASQKRLKDEMEIQEKFRRDEMERQTSRMSIGANGAAHETGRDDQEEEEPEGDESDVNGILDRYTRDSVYVDNRRTIFPEGLFDGDEPPVPTMLSAPARESRYESDEDIGLPYDRPDPESPPRVTLPPESSPREARRLPRPPAGASIPPLGAPLQAHGSSPMSTSTSTDTTTTTSPLRIVNRSSVDTAPTSTNPSSRSESFHTPLPTSAPGATENEPRGVFGGETEPHQGMSLQAKEIAGNEEVLDKVEQMQDAEEGHAGGQAVAMSLMAEEHAREEERRRAQREGEERKQTEREEDLRREQLAKSEAQEAEARRVEEQRLAEEQRIAEEQVVEKRRQEEREQEQRREEERLAEQRREDERIAEMERQEQQRMLDERRLEEERIAEEQRREQARLAEQQRFEEERQAEIRRKEQEKVEAEARRKEGIAEGLRRGKEGGGVMLSGWITVQTTKSMIWRRRWFNFYAREIQLFKSELDIKPIQTVPLGPSTHISNTYEESQVTGSFKVIDERGEEWYMFTDGTEEKETVLTAFAMVTR